MDVGFVGLGLMGRAMAARIAAGGHRVLGWNRSAIAPVAGVTLVATPGEAFAADVVFAMLADDAATRAVLLAPAVLAAARPGVVVVNCATISVAFSAELGGALAAAGLGYVAAPVFGRPDAAAAGQLHVAAAGAADALDRVRPLLALIGQKTWPLGDDPVAANAAKLGGNLMIALAIEAMAEAATVTGRHGVTATDFFALMTGTLFGGRVHDNYSAKIVAEDTEPGFRLVLGRKDVRLAQAAAATPLPLADAVEARMTAAIDAGLGERDWTALAAFAP